MIVMALDCDDGQRGEITIVDNATEAGLLVESLLESGLEQDRVRVFGGGEVSVRVSQRPVVSLTSDAPVAQPSETIQQHEDVPGDNTPPPTPPDADEPPVVGDTRSLSSMFRKDDLAVAPSPFARRAFQQPIQQQPEVAPAARRPQRPAVEPVRFSSLFRRDAVEEAAPAVGGGSSRR
jgi:hypothetical protein